MTNSTHSGRSGAQEPRVALQPKRADSLDATEAAFLSSGYGLTPDPWQTLILEAWLGRKRDGMYAAGRCGLAVPRQNGKNGILEVAELHKMVALGRRVLHTAHEVKTARKAFVRLASFFDNPTRHPEMAALVKEIRRTNGQEAIILNNGASCEFVARSRGSGRGYTVDDLVCDEAQELTDEQLEALLPTISSAPSGDPQIILTGTPPATDSLGYAFTRMRDDGHKAKDPRLSWHEWSVDAGADPDDRANWYATNPSLGRRLSLSVVSDERAGMSDAGFLRERCGMWLTKGGTASRLISAQAWSDTGVDEPPASGIKSFGVAFSADGERVAVAGALKVEDGPTHVELVGIHSGDMDGGIGSLADWLAERWRDSGLIVMSGRAGSSSLYEELRSRGVSAKAMRVATTPDYFTSCSMTLDAIRQRTLTHLASEGQAALDDSIAVCDKAVRGRDGAWGWRATTEDGDETPTEAISLALWAARTTKRNPNRPARGVVL